MSKPNADYYEILHGEYKGEVGIKIGEDTTGFGRRYIRLNLDGGTETNKREEDVRQVGKPDDWKDSPIGHIRAPLSDPPPEITTPQRHPISHVQGQREDVTEHIPCTDKCPRCGLEWGRADWDIEEGSVYIECRRNGHRWRAKYKRKIAGQTTLWGDLTYIPEGE